MIFNNMSLESSFGSLENIGYRIYIVRDKKVVLDADVAQLFRISTKRLNEKVRRSAVGFTSEDIFRVTVQELKTMRSQVVENGNDESYSKSLFGDKKFLATSTFGENIYSPELDGSRPRLAESQAGISPPKSLSQKGSGGRRHLPNVFTEKGFNQLSKIFNKLDSND